MVSLKVGPQPLLQSCLKSWCLLTNLGFSGWIFCKYPSVLRMPQCFFIMLSTFLCCTLNAKIGGRCSHSAGAFYLLLGGSFHYFTTSLIFSWIKFMLLDKIHVAGGALCWASFLSASFSKWFFIQVICTLSSASSEDFFSVHPQVCPSWSTSTYNWNRNRFAFSVYMCFLVCLSWSTSNLNGFTSSVYMCFLVCPSWSTHNWNWNLLAFSVYMCFLICCLHHVLLGFFSWCFFL